MSLEDDIRTLSALPVFDQMEVEAVRLIAFSAISKTLKAGEILFKAGDMTEGGYLVVSGSIVIEKPMPSTAPRQIIPAGALIGEVALIIETQCVGTAAAQEETMVLFVPRTLFLRVLQEFPSSATRMKSGITKRLVGFSEQLAKFRLDHFD
jgi:CRP-like cAMP-binding protein